MPHIHEKPGQHDITASAFIIREDEGATRCLVHYHRKADVLLQIGGHVDPEVSPWQAMVGELSEEAGYALGDLEVLQFTADRIKEHGIVAQPVPFAILTEPVGDEHLHDDLCYGFIAIDAPSHEIHEGESKDLRWLTYEELALLAETGEMIPNVLGIYSFLLSHLDSLARTPAREFSLATPTEPILTYKRGRPGEATPR